MKVTSLFLLLGLFDKASAESCACVAEDLGFAIDCSNTDAMMDAMNLLNSNGCANECSSELCMLNYYIIQAHHDFCPEATIPEVIEDSFHDFDTSCKACDITRDFVEGAPDCPLANCGDTSGNDAYASLISDGCNMDCSSDICSDLFFTLRVVHDDCPHDVLSRAAEDGLHDLERPCAQHICNRPNSKSSQLVCDNHGHDWGSYEWVGTFDTVGDLHQWSMQAQWIDGNYKYADPSMRLVFFSTDTTSNEAIYTNEIEAEFLIEGDFCETIQVGETISGIQATGSCYELHVGNDPDSVYPVDTTGIARIVVFAQHVPIEFERNRHYFQNSANVDIEPVVQESGGGGADHHHHDVYDHGFDHCHNHGHGHDHKHMDGNVDSNGDSYTYGFDHGHEHNHGHDHFHGHSYGVEEGDSGASETRVATAANIAVLLGYTLIAY